jgi:hypothetical protein
MIEDHYTHAEQVNEDPKAEGYDACYVGRLETANNGLADQEHEKRKEKP